MARLNARPPVEKLICQGCGCTDDAACEGGCHWVSRKPPVCSACVEAAGDIANAEPIEAGFFSAERCPASEVPAVHVMIWIDPTSGHCARCHMGFVA